MNEKIQFPRFDEGAEKPRAQTATGRLLEQTKLSRLPSLPRRSACANCGGSLDTTDGFQSAVKLCRRCLVSYANIGAILERYSEQKIRQIYQEQGGRQG